MVSDPQRELTKLIALYSKTFGHPLPATILHGATATEDLISLIKGAIDSQSAIFLGPERHESQPHRPE